MITKVLKLFFLTFCSVSYAHSQDLDQLPNTLEYSIDLIIEYDSKKLYGKCEMKISNESDEPIKNVPILLYRLLTVNAVENENDESLPYSQSIMSISGWEEIQVNFINISLNRLLSPGEERIIILEYEGFLFGYSAEGWRYVKDHIDKNFTLISTDGYGYPVIGYPSEKGMMKVAQQQYDYQIKVTIPEGVHAVTGGRLIEKTRTDDKATYIFHSKKPSWRLDIAISDYKMLESGENKVFYFANDSTSAVTIMKAMQDSYELYTSWFGELDNYMGFSIIEIPEGYSSQQDVAAIILSAENFKESSDMRTIYHEIAHSWNVRNMDDQPSRFETEGFAQLMQFLLLEKLDNKENAVAEAAQDFLERVRNRFIENQEYQNIPIKDYGIYDMTDFSYTLGMAVFAILYDLVGQENFNTLIGSFYSANNKKGATLDDFINHCKELATSDLEKFFDDWIYTTRGVKLVVEGKTYDELIEYYRE